MPRRWLALWPCTALGALLGLGSQWWWLSQHQWEQAALRLGVGLVGGAVVLGGLLALAVVAAGRFWPGLSPWARSTAWRLSGLSSWAGRLTWLALVLALALAGAWRAYWVWWLPGQGAEHIRAYHLEHLEPGGKGLAGYLYPGMAMAEGVHDLGVATAWDIPNRESLPGPMQENIVIRWLGALEARESGVYELGGVVDDGLVILVDGRPVVRDWKEAPPREATGRVTLSAGLHALEVRYSQLGGGATLRLFWRPPGGQRQPLAFAPLTPLQPGTPLAPLVRIRLDFNLDPAPGSTYPPFIGGRHWRLPWYGLQ